MLGDISFFSFLYFCSLSLLCVISFLKPKPRKIPPFTVNKSKYIGGKSRFRKWGERDPKRTETRAPNSKFKLQIFFTIRGKHTFLRSSTPFQKRKWEANGSDQLSVPAARRGLISCWRGRRGSWNRGKGCTRSH